LKYSNITSYFSIFNNTQIGGIQKIKQNFYIFSWKFFWKFMSWSRWIVIKLVGSKNVASFYYKYFGKHFNEPHVSELSRALFSLDRNFNHMLKTIVECLVKPNLYDLINRSKINKIHIIQGNNDKLYIPYGNALHNYNKKILYHSMNGSHHMVYHNPIETATKINAVLYK
jgi:Na+/phosphate symporter